MTEIEINSKNKINVIAWTNEPNYTITQIIDRIIDRKRRVSCLYRV